MSLNIKLLGLSLTTSAFLTACSMLPYQDDFTCKKGQNNGVCGSVTEVYDLSGDMHNLRMQANPEYAEAKKNEAKEAPKKVEVDTSASYKTQKLQEIAEAIEIRKIQNETPAIFRYYLAQNQLDGDYQRDFSDDYYGINASNDGKNTKISDSKDGKTDNKDSKISNGVKNDKKAIITKPHSKQDITKKSANMHNNVENVSSKNGFVVYDDNVSIGDTNGTIPKNMSLVDNNASVTDNNTSAMSNDLNLANNLNSADCKPSGDSKITQINAPVKVCVYRANIREEASCKANVLWVAKKGEVLEALYEQGGWIKLKDGSYVHKSIVTKN